MATDWRDERIAELECQLARRAPRISSIERAASTSSSRARASVFPTEFLRAIRINVIGVTNTLVPFVPAMVARQGGVLVAVSHGRP